MKHTLLKSLLVAVAVATFTINAAVPESTFSRIRQQQVEARKKLEAAEKAEGAKQSALLNEHAQLIQSMLSEMRALKPAATMTMDEHVKWIDEHQKVMDEMLTQMAKDHELMMNNCHHKK